MLRRKPSYSVNVNLEGGLVMSMRASIINELIKHIVFTRQQIPMAYEQLRDIVEHSQTPDKHTVGSPSSVYDKLTNKKVHLVIQHMDKVFHAMNEAFSCCRVISCVMIMIGGSIVTPKESYIIHLPPVDPELNQKLSLKSCLRRIFRELFTHDFFMDAGDITATNITVMFLASRHDNLTGFYTKPNYKLIERGRVLHIHLETCDATGGQDLSYQSGYDVNISGIEPITHSVDMLDVSNDDSVFSSVGNVSQNETMSTEASSSQDSASCDMSCDHTSELNDEIWYQVPTVVKGYKLKSH